MTTLPDRPNTALVVIDVQNNVVARAHRRDEVVANIAALVKRARASSTPVIWVQHAAEDLKMGSDGWQYVAELQRRDDEPLVHKGYGDSFEETSLENELARHRVGRLIVTGAQTDFCIRSTLHGAIARGYDAVLVSDAHTTDDMSWDGVSVPAESIITHTNTYWHWHSAPGRSGGTVTAAELDFSV